MNLGAWAGLHNPWLSHTNLGGSRTNLGKRRAQTWEPHNPEPGWEPHNPGCCRNRVLQKPGKVPHG